MKGAIFAVLALLGTVRAGATCPVMTSQHVFLDFTDGTPSCSPARPFCRFGLPITFTPGTFGYTFSCGPHVFTWNFGDGTSVVVNAPAFVTHTYVLGEQHDVTLKIENANGSITLSTVLFTGIYDVVGPPVTFTAKRLSGFQIAFTPSWPAGTAKATWDFGDGSPPITSNAPDTMVHEYANAGTYTVTLRGETDQGAVTVYSLNVTTFARQRAARH